MAAGHGLLKLLLVGEKSVGKTSIATRHMVDVFMEKYTPTIAIDFSIRTVLLDGQVNRLQLWDASGDDKFRSSLKSTCRDCHGVFIVYDITDKESFSKISYWLTYLGNLCLKNVPIFLIGNKSDLSDRKVTTAEGERAAKKHGLMFFETSAKDEYCITSMIEAVTRKVLESKNELDDAIAHLSGPTRSRQKISRTCSLL